MSKIEKAVAVIFLLAGAVAAQVISPAEIKDPDMRELQQQYLEQLKYVGNQVHAHEFDHPFYFSRRLDIDEQRQQRVDQRSLRFDKFHDQTVIEVTGNYYAAYPANMDEQARARHTFEYVVLPILKAAVPQFEKNANVQAYALEISHHLIGKVMDVTVEHPENVEFLIPQAAAQRLISAKNEGEEQAGLLDSQVFVNTQPTTLWVRTDVPEPERLKKAMTETGSKGTPPSGTPVPAVSVPVKIELPVRDTSEKALASLQTMNQPTVDKIVSEMDSQAHFVSYAPPKFVGFRQAVYLEMSVTTAIPASQQGSRYKLAALAFDDHISHLVRPLLAYFKNDSTFDGFAISTSLRLEGEKAGSSEAVEYFLPFAALHCYERYDCTGQQLLDSGVVLINGERVGLELQAAEAGPR